MAILSVDEMLGARSGGIDAQWRRTYRRAFRVVCSDQFTGALGARLAIPVSPGNSYVLKDGAGAIVEHDTFAFATNIQAQVDPACDDDCQWIVTVDYGPYDPTTFPENPLNHPLRISWGLNRFERAVEETIADANGDKEAILNSAGDYFDPPPVFDDSRPTLRIVRNEQSYDPNFALLWKDTLNKGTFFGFDPGTVKMTMPTAELEYSPVCGFYYPVTYEFEIRPEGWALAILDQGLRTLDVTSNKQKAALDENGAAVTSPVLLDGNGGRLTVGDTPAFLFYDIYDESDYGLLNLDPKGAPGQGP